MSPMKKSTVVCQKWEESERGWGNRPDGYSLHLNDADRLAFIKSYWDRMPKESPDEYSRPCGTPYSCDVEPATFNKVVGSKNGIRLHSNNYPGSGGTDGWVSAKKKENA